VPASPDALPFGARLNLYTFLPVNFTLALDTSLYLSPRRSYPFDMDDSTAKMLKPGAIVKITQQIAGRDYTLTSDVSGTVLSFAQQRTGSWYAHSKDEKLWLDRLTLRKEDGEMTQLILDEFSHIEILSPSPDAAPAKV
jgi:hypothetical protein